LKNIIIHTCLILLLAAAPVSSVDDEKEYNAAYNYKKWDCEILNDKALIHISNSLTIYNLRGEEYGFVSFSEDQFRRIKKCHITLKDHNNNITGEFEKKDLAKVCGFGMSFQIYSDICYYNFTPVAPGYPYTIEYEYEFELKSLFFLRGLQVVNEIPVNNYYAKLTFPNDQIIHCKQYAINIPRQQTIDNGKITYHWKADELLPLDYDTLDEINYHWGGWLVMVSDRIEFADVVLDGISWSNIGQCYYNIAQEHYLESSAVNSVLDSNVIYDLMRNIYDEVCRQTRYVSVSINESGWKPRNARVTKSSGYGDCKDMSTLLISRLRLTGIRSYPVLVLTKGEGIIDTTFPGLNFNHVFVMAVVDNDTLWMEPTCDVCPFGEIPYSDQSISGLLVTDTGGVLVCIPASDFKVNRAIRTTKVYIDKSFNLKYDCTNISTGNRSHWARGRLPHNTNEELVEYCESLTNHSKTSLKIINYGFENINDKYKPFITNISAASTRPLKPIGNKLYLDPLIFNTGFGDADSMDANRIRPLNLNYPWYDMDSVIITYDADLEIDSIILPQNDSAENRFAYYSLESSIKNDTVFMVISYAHKTSQIMPEEFAEYNDYKKYSEKQFIKFVLSK